MGIGILIKDELSTAHELKRGRRASGKGIRACPCLADMMILQ